MLKFSLLGIPTGVHATFLFVAVLGAGRYRGIDIAIWTASAFIAILIHEMGHALVARSFGAVNVNVTLYGLGGVTNFSVVQPLSHGRSFLISAAGSATGIIAGGMFLLLKRGGEFADVSQEVGVFIDSFVFTALVWGVLNWVPIVPLDGGHMVRHLAAMVNEDRAAFVGQVVTWMTVAIVVPFAVSEGYDLAAVLVVVFAFSGLRAYRADKKPRQRGPTDATGASEPPQFPI